MYSKILPTLLRQIPLHRGLRRQSTGEREVEKTELGLQQLIYKEAANSTRVHFQTRGFWPAFVALQKIYSLSSLWCFSSSFSYEEYPTVIFRLSRLSYSWRQRTSRFTESPLSAVACETVRTVHYVDINLSVCKHGSWGSIIFVSVFLKLWHCSTAVYWNQFYLHARSLTYIWKTWYRWRSPGKIEMLDTMLGRRLGESTM